MYSVVRYTYTHTSVQRYLAYYLAGTSDDMDWVFEKSVYGSSPIISTKGLYYWISIAIKMQ